LGILEDVPIMVGDFYMPVDFVILNMLEDAPNHFWEAFIGHCGV